MSDQSTKAEDFWTDERGYRWYESDLRARLRRRPLGVPIWIWATYLGSALLCIAAVEYSSGFRQEVAKEGLGAIALVWGVAGIWIFFQCRSYNETLWWLLGFVLRDKEYRASDAARLASVEPPSSSVAQQQPHGHGYDEGTI